MSMVRFGRGLLLLLVMAGCSSSPTSLVDTGAEADPTLYIFVTHECPIANRYAPEIGRIAEEHLDLVGPTVVVYADANALVKDCATHFGQYYLASDAPEDEAHVASVTMVHDAQHEWVKRFDARAVPTAVIARGKTVLYHGRIDDRNPRLGARRVQAGQQDLREALAALRAGTLTPTRTTVVGCSIDRTAG
jgi:hypothetical protein